MEFPWFLKPDLLLHAEMLDTQDELIASANSSHAADQRQDQQLAALQARVAELEKQLLALEIVLAEKGILPPRPEDAPAVSPAASAGTGPVVFPARTDGAIICPRCGKRQRGNRNLCLFCETPFQYENE